MSHFKLGDYIQVDERIAEFREKYPEGSLQPALPEFPFDIRTVGDKTFIVYSAAAYRTPDDKRPGIGCAWEQFPGATPYTRNSELMNAETSAWGRAIIAALAADAKRGIASAEEVRNRQAEREDAPAPKAAPAASGEPEPMRPAQRGKLWAVAKEKFGDEPTARLEQFARDTLKTKRYEFTSLTDLTKHQASIVIDALKLVTVDEQLKDAGFEEDLSNAPEIPFGGDAA